MKKTLDGSQKNTSVKVRLMVDTEYGINAYDEYISSLIALDIACCRHFLYIHLESLVPQDNIHNRNHSHSGLPTSAPSI